MNVGVAVTNVYSAEASLLSRSETNLHPTSSSASLVFRVRRVGFPFRSAPVFFAPPSPMEPQRFHRTIHALQRVVQFQQVVRVALITIDDVGDEFEINPVYDNRNTAVRIEQTRQTMLDLDRLCQQFINQALANLNELCTNAPGNRPWGS